MKKKNYEIIVAFMMVLCCHTSYSQGYCLAPDINLAGESAFNDYVIKFKAEGRHLNTDLKIIPIVIHVICRNLADRLQITWPRIQGQIEVTNKHLRRLNANANETRPEFLPVAADCNIQVCLATRKPNRSRFNGIIYHYYPDFKFSDITKIREATILDPDRYFNVWVIPDNGSAGAVAPWDKTATRDGFFIGAKTFGTFGSNLDPSNNKGVIFTHELGHCLGLLHTFHDSFGFIGECELIDDESIGDFCGDTPLDWREFPLIGADCMDIERHCSEAPPDFFIAQTENYMGYNPDRCINMFSKDQRARMRACLSSLRWKLTSPLNRVFTGINCNDVRGNCNGSSQLSLVPSEVNDNDYTPGKSISKNDISIFPNPVKSNVHITYRNPAVKNMSIKVYNQTGVKLKELHSNTAIYELNLDGLPDGVYYLNMTIDNVPVTKHVIKTGSGRVSSAQ